MGRESTLRQQQQQQQQQPRGEAKRHAQQPHEMMVQEEEGQEPRPQFAEGRERPKKAEGKRAQVEEQEQLQPPTGLSSERPKDQRRGPDRAEMAKKQKEARQWETKLTQLSEQEWRELQADLHLWPASQKEQREMEEKKWEEELEKP